MASATKIVKVCDGQGCDRLIGIQRLRAWGTSGRGVRLCEYLVFDEAVRQEQGTRKAWAVLGVLGPTFDGKCITANKATGRLNEYQYGTALGCFANEPEAFARLLGHKVSSRRSRS